MISKRTIQLDDRDVARIVEQLLARRLGYAPEWQLQERSADAAIARIFARYVYAIIQRLNQAPEKNRLAFLDLLGLGLVPAQSARAPLVFRLSADAADSQIPAGSQIAAPPPPGGNQQIIFETETATGVAAAQLKEVVSLWPGRDQYLDHSADFLEGKPFQAFRKPLLKNTPHALYIAHDTLLALAGSITLEVEVELTQVSGEPLNILWEYWDGQVWRGFKSIRPACSEKEAQVADSTNGFTRSGRYRLESECAESSKTVVNGIEAFWIRGQLTEPLLPESARALPLVDRLRLSSLINQELKAILTPVIQSNDPFPGAAATRIFGRAINEAGNALESVDVKITSPDDPNFPEAVYRTNSSGEYNSGGQPSTLPSKKDYDFEVSFLSLPATAKLRDLPENRVLEVALTFDVTGLDPDKAFSDGTKLDVTKPFFPFGQQPQPGSVFYFNSEEVFTKPGARAQIYVARTVSPLDKAAVEVETTPSPAINAASDSQNDRILDHLIAWEYWNDRRWVTMFQSTSQPNPTKDLNTTEIIEFTVPSDMEVTTVNEQEGLWMRARLVSGGFGFTQEVSWRAEDNSINRFTYVISQPPSLAAFRLGYTWRYGPFHPEYVITHNDFQYEDHTYEATWPGETFLPFNRARDVTPALYLGFDRKLPTDLLGIYFDVEEKKGETRGPAMVWEYFDGSRWRDFSVEDETRNLRLPGILSFIASADNRPLARFGAELHWLRGRLKEDGPPGEPMINGIFPNGVWASQRQTFSEEPLGISSGLPDQIFAFNQIPVLDGERIEVQELSGPRANVEWRIIAMEVEKEAPNVVRDLEETLGHEGAQTDIIKGSIRLRRDRNKKVIEVWVRWKEEPHLFDSEQEDRHYVIDRARGLVFFGDGVKGKIPPPSSPIVSRQHRAGGGIAGNVPARAISQLLGPIPGIQEVFNPRAAEGGADGETIESFSLRGPQTVRHRGRAITPSDYETLAHEASPAVAVARAIPTRNAAGRRLPGWITLLIIPQSEDRRPWPSFGLREHVRKHIEEHAPADLASARQIHIIGPDYLSIDVTATIAPKDPASAGTVEKSARLALEDFLHPLRGGPERRGWERGRDVYLSDVAAVLERVEGVDYVEELALLTNGVERGERVAVADDRIVIAGDIRLKLKAAEA